MSNELCIMIINVVFDCFKVFDDNISNYISNKIIEQCESKKNSFNLAKKNSVKVATPYYSKKLCIFN